jgi:spore germination cell wall hydrolase CwlJ-like protein
MDIKSTLIFVLSLLSVTAIAVGIVNDTTSEPLDVAEAEPAGTYTPILTATPTAEEQAVTAEEDPVGTVVQRYADLIISEADREEMARIVWLEARGESAEGQQAVAEVVLNRVIHDAFPDSVHEVIHEGEDTSVPQFSSVYSLDTAQPTATQYEAVDAAMYGPSILPTDVVFFSVSGENDRVWGTIGKHIFCYEYVWD